MPEIKITAVEWLVNELTYKAKNGEDWISYDSCVDMSEYINEAKKMEKEQIINAYAAGYTNGVESMIEHDLSVPSPKGYYNKTFKKDGE